MNNMLKMILAMGAVALLAACARMAGRSCDDEVTVNHKGAYLKARPETAEVCPGGTLRVKLVPPITSGSAHTAPGSQNPGANWLSGRTSRGDEIVLIVEEKEVEVGDVYKYNITIDGVGTLDPRVRVIPSFGN